MRYVVECEPDYCLVESLTLASRKQIRHAGNKPGVLKQLKKLKDCKGMVDEDPSSIQPPDMLNFKEIESSPQDKVSLLGHPKGGTLVILSPRLEDWIIDACRFSKIEPNNYGLPKDPETMHAQINIRLGSFAKLVEDLKAQSSRMKVLTQYLTKSP